MNPTQDNVDRAEVAKFDTAASRWWDPGSEFEPLHRINPLRLRHIREWVGDLSGRKVLDVGCGGGILSESLAREGASVTGIDPGEENLAVARLHALESEMDVRYENTTAEGLAQRAPASFDVVTCLEMLEHVPDPASVVRACARLVRPGGHVVFSTLNRNPRAWLLAILGAEYVLRLLPRGTHTYEQFIRPSELAHWARESGLTLSALHGIGYNPLTRDYFLTADTSVNYLAHCLAPTAEEGGDETDT